MFSSLGYVLGLGIAIGATSFAATLGISGASF